MNDDVAELERLRTAMTKLNRLRSNSIATQNAGWSNHMYPFVAILDEAGFEIEGATDEQCKEHLACYGGAGRTPMLLEHPPYESPLGKPAPMPDISGSVQIHAERWRQQKDEGWTAEHDDEHSACELTMAATSYAYYAIGQVNGVCWPDEESVIPTEWPWHMDWWKPSDDPIRNLVKAGALIAAEIDRLQRADG